MTARNVTDAELAELRSLAAQLLERVDKIIAERAGDKLLPRHLMFRREPPPEAYASVLERMRRDGEELPPAPKKRPAPSPQAIADVLARQRRRELKKKKKKGKP